MRTLLIPLMLLVSIVLSAQTPQKKQQPAETTKNQLSPEKKKETTVIICNSKNAKVYHKYNCKGLKNCKAGTKTVTLTKAQEMGRRACKICYE